MERHDPLGSIEPPEQSPRLAQRKRPDKLPPLLCEISEVKNDTLAFLYGGPAQQPGDYSRNLQRAGIIRESFVQFCTLNSHYANWRQAWAAFMAENPVERPGARETIWQPAKPAFVAVTTPPMPRWKQRLYQLARA